MELYTYINPIFKMLAPKWSNKRNLTEREHASCRPPDRSLHARAIPPARFSRCHFHVAVPCALGRSWLPGSLLVGNRRLCYQGRFLTKFRSSVEPRLLGDPSRSLGWLCNCGLHLGEGRAWDGLDEKDECGSASLLKGDGARAHIFSGAGLFWVLSVSRAPVRPSPRGLQARGPGKCTVQLWTVSAAAAAGSSVGGDWWGGLSRLGVSAM